MRILKQEISHLSLQPLEALRCLKMWEYLSQKRCLLTHVLKCLLVSPIQQTPQLAHVN